MPYIRFQGGDYNDLYNKPPIPTDTNDLTNSVGFVTSGVVVGYTTEGYVDNLVAISTFSGDYNDLTNKPSIPSIVGLASEGYVDNLVAISTSGLLSSSGNGSNLTGIVTSITAGSGISVDQSTGNVTINLDDYISLTGVNATGVITASGGINVTGIVTATTFSGNLPTTDLTGTITNAQLAGSIDNSKLVNNSVSFGGVTVSLGGTDATPAFDLSDATNIPAGQLTGTLPAIDGSNLTNLPSPSAVYIKCPLVSVNTVNNATTYTNRDVINTTSDFDSGSFTIASDGITVPEAGIYSCSFTCYMTGSVQRANVGVKFTINGTEQSEVAAMGYIRNADGHNETSLAMTTLYNLSASDKVNVVFARLANTGTVTLTTNSSINLHKL